MLSNNLPKVKLVIIYWQRIVTTSRLYQKILRKNSIFKFTSFKKKNNKLELSK